MLVVLRLQVDVALRALQRPEVAFDIFDIRIRMQQKADHKRRVENLSEPLLFNQVQWSAKHVCGIDFTVQQRRQAILWLADKAQLDLVRLEDFLQRLNGREITTGVIAHSYLDLSEVARLFNRGLVRNDYRRRGNGIRMSPHLTMPGR